MAIKFDFKIRSNVNVINKKNNIDLNFFRRIKMYSPMSCVRIQTSVPETSKLFHNVLSVWKSSSRDFIQDPSLWMTQTGDFRVIWRVTAIFLFFIVSFTVIMLSPHFYITFSLQLPEHFRVFIPFCRRPWRPRRPWPCPGRNTPIPSMSAGNPREMCNNWMPS